MREDKNFCRRMVVCKFSNTPPFHMKSFENSLRQGPQKPPAKCPNRDSGDCLASKCSSQSDSQKSGVVPRVLENFRKIEPRHSAPSVPQNFGRKLGKNIPNHNMMNILLENLLSDETGPLNVEDDSEELYIEINRGGCCPRNRHNVNQMRDSAEKYFMNAHDNHRRTRSIPAPPHRVLRPTKEVPAVRVDQMTSTTGLHWVPENRRPSNRRPHPHFRKVPPPPPPQQQPMRCTRHRPPPPPRFKCAQNCRDKQVLEVLDSSSQNNIVEYVNPNIFNSNSSEFEQQPSKELICRRKKVKRSPPQKQKYTRDLDLKPVKPDTSGTLESTRSFVRVQVDKYNKLLGSNHKTKTKEPPKTDDYSKLIQSVKQRVPKIQDSEDEENTAEWQDWSANESTVNFPRETKHAMEKMRIKSSPVIKTTSDQGSDKSNYRKLTVLPCHKDLLCNRGFHEGECVR